MRIAKIAVVLVALLGLFAVGTPSARAEEAAKKDIVPERILGKADAPITVQEFVSLTCSHCAQFYNDVLPELKAKYVDTGKVRFILRDFPLDGIALRAASLARCMPEDQYYSFVSILFKNQAQWAFVTNPMPALTQYAKLGGLSDERAKACIEDAKMMDAIAADLDMYKQKYSIEATPSFVINEGKDTMKGVVPASEFAAAFDRILADIKK